MNCRACAVLRQVALNWGLAVDHLANAVLLGDPNETLSQRTARANRAGHRWAGWACRALSIINKDHCEWSLSPGPSIGREIWHLSKATP